MFENKPLLIGIALGIVLLILGPILYGIVSKPEVRRGSTGPKDLVVWNLFDDEEVFSRIIQDYRVANPGAQIEYKRFNNINRYKELLFDEMAEGEGPDIFVLNASEFIKHKEKIVPLPDGFGGLDTELFKEVFVPATYSDLVYSTTVEIEGEPTEVEQVYGMPLYVDNLALFYNEDLLEQYAKSAFPGDTWSKIVSQTRKMTQKKGGAISLAAIALGGAHSIHRTPDLYSLLLMQFGAQLYDEEGKDSVVRKAVQYKGKPFDAGSESLEFLASFADPDSKNYTWQNTLVGTSPSKEIGAFVRGEVAMIFGYSYYAALIEQARIDEAGPGVTVIPKNVIKVAPVPQVDAGDDLQRRVTLGDYYPFAVSRNAKNPDAAWNFLLYLASDTQMKRYFEGTKKPVSKRNLIEELAEKNPQYEVFLKQALDARTPGVLNKGEFDESIRTIIANIHAEVITPDGAIGLIDEMLRCQAGQLWDLPAFEDASCLVTP